MNGITLAIILLLLIEAIQQGQIAALQRRQRAINARLDEVALAVYREDKK